MDTEKGLLNKYHLTKTDGTPVDPDAEYFCLRVDRNNAQDQVHRSACRIALNTYAILISDHLPELARDIIKRYGITPEESKEYMSDMLPLLHQYSPYIDNSLGTELFGYVFMAESIKNRIWKVKYLYTFLSENNLIQIFEDETLEQGLEVPETDTFYTFFNFEHSEAGNEYWMGIAEKWEKHLKDMEEYNTWRKRQQQ